MQQGGSLGRSNTKTKQKIQTEGPAFPMSSQNKAMCPWTGKKENKNAFAL
jgi:hypothetical protein